MSAPRIKFLLRALVSVGLVVFILRKVNWLGLVVVLDRLDWRWAILGWASTFILISSLAFRWRIFLRLQLIELPFRKLLGLTWTGQFFNSILPGSTGGDLVKIYQVCRLAPDRKAAAASTVLVDRLSALIALVVLAGSALAIDPRPLRLLAWPSISRQHVLLVTLALGTAGVTAGWIICRLLKKTRIFGHISRTLSAARVNLTLNANLVLATVLAFAIHFWNFFTLYLFARALHIPISYSQMLLIMPVVLFLVLIPITINGHGLRELLLIGCFRYLGIAVGGPSPVSVQDTAVALSLVAVANDLLWSLPGGLIYLLNFRTQRAASKLD